MPPSHVADAEPCYRAVKSRDRRFDGVFYIAVRTTGIYCRPSCPATHPGARATSTFYPTAAAAQAAGLPRLQALPARRHPGQSPEWDVAADVAGRAMRLIADGVVDRDGRRGAGAAARLHPAAPQPPAHRRARRRAARPGPGQRAPRPRAC